jgi:hypothetical protein
LGVSGAGSKEGRLEFLGDLEQLVRCLPGHGDLMRGQHDLDLRGQNSATAEPIRRFVITRAIAAAAALTRRSASSPGCGSNRPHTRNYDTQDDSPVTVRLVVSS